MAVKAIELGTPENVTRKAMAELKSSSSFKKRGYGTFAPPASKPGKKPKAKKGAK